MVCYRITKYNPQYRNSKGQYTRTDWISVDDVGTVYDGKVFSLSDYLLVEDQYSDAIISIMNETKINNLKIQGLEKNDYLSVYKGHSDELKNIYELLEEGMMFNSSSIASIVKLILRENLWARLVHQDLEVHFGYDYYMYVCSKHSFPKSIIQINENDLFVEPMRSPYL